MKKHLLFIAFALVATNLHAQFKLFKNVDELGLIGGLSSVTLRGGEGIEEGRQFQLGYCFGLNLKFDLFKNQRLKIDSKILFDRKGGKQEVLVGYFDPVDQVEKKGFLEATISLDYITLPINLEYSFSKNKKLYILSGVYISYLRKGKIVVEYPFLNQTNTSQVNNYKNYDAGVSFGLGCRIPITNRRDLRLELCNYYGILDISDQSANVSTTPVVRTNSVLFSLIYSLNK